jgi:hypothetical protein
MNRRVKSVSMRKKVVPLFIFLTLVVTAPGCWQGRELNARAFVTAVALDRATADEADPSEILLSIQVPVPAKMGAEGGDGGGGGGDQPFVVFGTTTKLVQIGIRQLQRQIDRELFFGHTQLILINKDLAETMGIDRLLDYFKRDFRVQRMTRIAIIDVEAREILNLQPPTLRICFRRRVEARSITSPILAVFWWNSRMTGSSRSCPGSVWVRRRSRREERRSLKMGSLLAG